MSTTKSCAGTGLDADAVAMIAHLTRARFELQGADLDDLEQEVALALLEAADSIAAAHDPEAYAHTVAKHAGNAFVNRLNWHRPTEHEPERGQGREIQVESMDHARPLTRQGGERWRKRLSGGDDEDCD